MSIILLVQQTQLKGKSYQLIIINLRLNPQFFECFSLKNVQAHSYEQGRSDTWGAL